MRPSFPVPWGVKKEKKKKEKRKEKEGLEIISDKCCCFLFFLPQEVSVREGLHWVTQFCTEGMAEGGVFQALYPSPLLILKTFQQPWEKGWSVCRSFSNLKLVPCWSCNSALVSSGVFQQTVLKLWSKICAPGRLRGACDFIYICWDCLLLLSASSEGCLWFWKVCVNNLSCHKEIVAP